ncbi:MAG: hypothetical protein CVV11_15820 [Gammaproteobacteria bacterium HGW-Gammaproteobacteria-15]|nr:MAG: hypothetical protein CVV11_15820 [Gammaproteobacteria bacterium HGW-Gammaproteobacteria-15]
MKKLFLLVVLLFSNGAFAGLIGSIEHTYGSSAFTPGFLANQGCDTKNANSLTVKDNSGCQRFVDLFDFSAFNFDTIEYFQLDLTFSSTKNDTCFFFICDYESWHVRPAASTTNAPASGLQSLIRANGITQQSFFFTADNLSVFADIVDNKKFYLWFAENSLGNDQFNLYGANLSLHGTLPTVNDVNPVPAPAGIALLSLGLLLLRRFKK